MYSAILLVWYLHASNVSAKTIIEIALRGKGTAPGGKNTALEGKKYCTWREKYCTPREGILHLEGKILL
jgi:hypothetical protein